MQKPSFLKNYNFIHTTFFAWLGFDFGIGIIGDQSQSPTCWETTFSLSSIPDFFLKAFLF